MVGTDFGMNWYYRGSKLPFKKFIRAFEPGFLPEFYHQASTGKLIERQLYFFPFWLNLQNGGYLAYSITPVYQNLTDPFEPLGVTIAPGEYDYLRQQIWVSSDHSKMINLVGQFDWGTYFDGKLATIDLRLQFAPLPHISLIGTFNRNHFKEVGVSKTTARVDLYGIEGRFAMNPRLQLIGFYQYNTENSANNYNIRLAWEYQPLSFIYFVFNRRGFTNTQGKTQTDDHIIGKISYLRQL